ncbi:hypothetical protein ASF48_10585 [Rathayibacter sp. Leaf299]|uniref:amino acid ABC transporter permease n=1 Tax=unclassified Rathayibacter TaxID=2609250 RepID=UPI0006F60162|nr:MULTISPECIES: amino acid ABC transporter permease [unclassified Rathayibacter]KQQ20991.1 hypothetical protein ASF48_10585 [Rathayibacter sp. Leaf299]
MTDFFAPWPDYFPQFLPGLLVTIELTVLSLLVGLALAVVFAVWASSPRRIVRWTAIAVIEIGRGVPGLITLYIVYFGLPQVNVTLPAFAACVVAFGYTSAAYMSEILRAGIRSVDRGQVEAGEALSLTHAQRMRLIVLPQAVRRVVPPLIGYAILLYQGTSLAYAVSVPELLSRAYTAASLSYQFASSLVLAGVMYASISLTVLVLLRIGSAHRDRPVRRLSPTLLVGRRVRA